MSVPFPPAPSSNPAPTPAQAAAAAAQQAAAAAASAAPAGGVSPAFLAGMPMGPPGSAPAGSPGSFPPGAFPFMANLPFPGGFPSGMGAMPGFNPAMLGGYRGFPGLPPGSPMEKQFFAQVMAATQLAQQQFMAQGKKKAIQQQNSQINIKKLGTLGKKLSAAIAGGKDSELDKQLTAIARQKQMHAVPMTPDVRLMAYMKRETVRPEPKMTCKNQHKVTATQAKKSLMINDVHMCPELGCGSACGGNDAHPLHLNVKFLNPQDKHNYLDSCRWLSKNEVENQAKEYIKGHPLVYPHLAAGVLFNDETDAWRGYVLGWNIYFWHMDIERYWTTIRRQLEEAAGAGLDDREYGTTTADASETGPGKRKKRKLVGESASEAQATLDEAEDDAAMATAMAISAEMHHAGTKRKAEGEPAAAAAASSAPSPQ